MLNDILWCFEFVVMRREAREHGYDIDVSLLLH